MVQIQIDYEGGLHCSAVHGPSGATLSTDAPVDNHGRGEAFSPTDLVVTALGSCIATTMAIVAERKNVALEGTHITVRKHMSTDTPRRISKIEVDLAIPLPADHPERPLLEATARGCPVHHSLHPDVEIVMDWRWTG